MIIKFFLACLVKRILIKHRVSRLMLLRRSFAHLFLNKLLSGGWNDVAKRCYNAKALISSSSLCIPSYRVVHRNYY